MHRIKLPLVFLDTYEIVDRAPIYCGAIFKGYAREIIADTAPAPPAGVEEAIAIDVIRNKESHVKFAKVFE
jgi:hypothetical protein